MSDQDEDKKNINQDSTDNESENKPLVDENNQPESVDSNNNDFSSEKRKQFDNDYEKLMSERGEINKPRPFA